MKTKHKRNCNSLLEKKEQECLDHTRKEVPLKRSNVRKSPASRIQGAVRRKYKAFCKGNCKKCNKTVRTEEIMAAQIWHYCTMELFSNKNCNKRLIAVESATEQRGVFSKREFFGIDL